MLRHSLSAAVLSVVVLGPLARAEDPWVVYDGFPGPGNGKHIVLISGDEEYRSEEGLPQLGKILAKRHGFKCTVLFAIDPESGTIDPNNNRNVPGLEALDDADLMIIALRWRDLPECFPSPSTCWRRLRDWEQAGIWLKVGRAFLGEFDEAGRLDWHETFADGSFSPAKKGATVSARPSAARARNAWYWSTARVFLWEFSWTRPARRR